MNTYQIKKIGNKQVLKHRFIMEQYLGRKLLASEIVHHKDGDKGNNEISNLEILTDRSEHLLKHARLRREKYPLKPAIKNTKLYLEQRKKRNPFHEIGID